MSPKAREMGHLTALGFQHPREPGQPPMSSLYSADENFDSVLNDLIGPKDANLPISRTAGEAPRGSTKPTDLAASKSAQGTNSDWLPVRL